MLLLLLLLLLLLRSNAAPAGSITQTYLVIFRPVSARDFLPSNVTVSPSALVATSCC
jgi:hypothetical protein